MSFLDRLIPNAVQAEQPGLYMTMKSLLDLPNTQKTTMCSHDAKDLTKTWRLFWETSPSLAGGSFVGCVAQLAHDHPKIHSPKKTFTHSFYQFQQ